MRRYSSRRPGPPPTWRGAKETLGALQRLDVHGLERGGRGDGLHVHTGELDPGQVGGVEGESGAVALVEADGRGAAGDLAHAGRAGRQAGQEARGAAALQGVADGNAEVSGGRGEGDEGGQPMATAAVSGEPVAQ